MKRLCAMILVVVFLLSVPVNAAQTTMRAPTLEAKPGETILIPVEIINNSGLAAWMVELTWDKDALEYIPDSISTGDGFSGGTLIAVKGDSGSLKVTWFSTENVPANGTMFTVQMKVNDHASGTYSIQVDCSEENTIDVNEKIVPISVQSGSVSTESNTTPPEVIPTPEPETNPTPEAEKTDRLQEDSTAPEKDTPAESNGDRNSFCDVPYEHWAYDSIHTLAARGIVSGVGDGRFDPDSNVTRAQFVKMIAGLVNADVAGKTVVSMTDVPATAWYAPYVAWALETGVTSGTSETTFSPNARITREQAATLLYRFVRNNNVELPAMKEAYEFQDEPAFSNYARNAIRAMQQAGILSGTGNGMFEPQGTTTRAAAAKMLAMVLEHIDEMVVD